MKKLTKKKINCYVKELLLLGDLIDGKITRKEWYSRGFPYIIQDMLEIVTGEDFDTSVKWNAFVEKHKEDKKK